MAKLNDIFFADYQREKLISKGVTEQDEINILISSKFGGKLVEIVNKKKTFRI